MEKKLFKTGDTAPVSGNYLFEKHDGDVTDCVLRPRVYLHLRKGMKLPLHDECQNPAVWSLMTVTEEENDPNIVGM